MSSAKVDEQLAVLAEDLGAHRDPQGRVRAIVAVAVAAHAMDAGLGLEMLVVAEVDQGVQALDRLDPDVAAPATVTAVRATVLNVFLPPERHGPAAAVSGPDVDLAFVEEFHGSNGTIKKQMSSRPWRSGEPGPRRRRGASAPGSRIGSSAVRDDEGFTLA